MHYKLHHIKEVDIEKADTKKKEEEGEMKFMIKRKRERELQQVLSNEYW